MITAPGELPDRSQPWFPVEVDEHAGGVEVVGGQIGATVGRRMSPTVLRVTVITVGLVVAFRLLLA